MKKLVSYVPLTLLLILASRRNGVTQDKNETINDENTRVVYFEELRYPLSARVTHIQGIVVVKVILDNSGRVVDSLAISGAKTLVTESVSNAKNWRFQPSPQKAAVIVYQFRIDDGLCHGAVSSNFIFHPPNFASITSCEPVVEP